MAIQFSSGCEAVDRLGQIDLTLGGAFNIIPDTWYKAFKTPSGLTNLNACVILSEICYWYKPTVMYDEAGHILKWEKRFDADVLQKSYQELSDKFGLTKRQCQQAVIYLEEMGLVKRELRNIITKNGISLGNVLFIHLNVDRLLEVTFPEEKANNDTLLHSNVRGAASECKRGYITMQEGLHSNVRGIASECKTYTKNTTKTTTEITTSSSPSSNVVPIREEKKEKRTYRDLVAENICLDDLLHGAETDTEKERRQMLYEIICKTVNSRAKTIRINSEDMPLEVVKSQFLKLGYEEIVYVCDVLDTPTERPIGNLEGYIRTLLYNSKNLAKEYWTQKTKYNEHGGGREKKEKSKSQFNSFPQRQDYDFEELERKLLRN